MSKHSEYFDSPLTSVLAGFVLFCVIMVLVIVPLNWVSKYRCLSETRDIGFPSRWQGLGQCQIEVEEDRWIPLENYYFTDE